MASASFESICNTGRLEKGRVLKKSWRRLPEMLHRRVGEFRTWGREAASSPVPLTPNRLPSLQLQRKLCAGLARGKTQARQ